MKKITKKVLKRNARAETYQITIQAMQLPQKAQRQKLTHLVPAFSYYSTVLEQNDQKKALKSLAPYIALSLKAV